MSVYDCYCNHFLSEETECVVQEEHMNETAREAFLSRFEETQSKDSFLIGFCVMGGLFGEGIDLKHDSLIGVLVVGTGVPQVCNERELLKRFFDEQGENGFDYAYRIPGMNKVLQAAGRVIRTSEDVGVIALLDERFLQNSYRQMFPREWDGYEVVNRSSIAKRVERFWDEWLT
jgi:Rad3-related DNA helicase